MSVDNAAVASHMVDGIARVTGQVEYALNFSVPGMLHARLLRSPHPHATIRSIDTSEAEQLPGVAAVLSRNDLLGNDRFDPYYGPLIHDQTPVALDKVRFVGDVVAAVAADDLRLAQQAIDLIEVDYQELPAVFDAEEALAPGAPVIHEQPRWILPARGDLKARWQGDRNVIFLFTQRKGDVERGFAEADQIVEHTYFSPSVEHMALEPRVSLVDAREGQITIWTASQNPYAVQEQVAGIFKIPTSHVRVIVFTVGGAYGGKLQAKLDPVAALLSWKAHRPVRLVMPRNEDFLYATQQACKIELKTGVNSDGTLVAHQASCYFNGGPYAETTANVITRAYAAPGPYRMPNLSSDSYGVYTNATPAGAFRGYGITQVVWAHESQMDIIADALGMDPLELRLKNVLRKGDSFSTGEPVAEMHYVELLEEAARRIGWRDGPLVVRDGHTARAKAITAIVKGMATPTTSSAVVKLNADGSLNVLTSAVELGQGSRTVLAQIAAESAGVPVGSVTVSLPDTAFTPYDLMTAASRTTFCMGTAIEYAVDDVKRQLQTLAAPQLEVAPNDVVVDQGHVHVAGVPDRSLTYSEVIRRSRQGSVLGHGTFVASKSVDGHEVVMDLETGQGYGSAEWHPAVAACEVEVDLETGKTRVLKLHCGLYVGRVINRQLCELQVEGSAAFGLGQALFEEVVYDERGKITNPNMSDYMIASFEDVPPEVTVHLLEPEDVHEVHGIGETALPPVRPAIGNAICRAIGARIYDLPITPEKVLDAIEAKNRTPPRPKATVGATS